MADTCNLCGAFNKAHPPSGECPRLSPQEPRAVPRSPQEERKEMILKFLKERYSDSPKTLYDLLRDDEDFL